MLRCPCHISSSANNHQNTPSPLPFRPLFKENINARDALNRIFGHAPAFFSYNAFSPSRPFFPKNIPLAVVKMTLWNSLSALAINARPLGSLISIRATQLDGSIFLGFCSSFSAPSVIFDLKK